MEERRNNNNLVSSMLCSPRRVTHTRSHVTFVCLKAVGVSERCVGTLLIFITLQTPWWAACWATRLETLTWRRCRRWTRPPRRWAPRCWPAWPTTSPGRPSPPSSPPTSSPPSFTLPPLAARAKLVAQAPPPLLQVGGSVWLSRGVIVGLAGWYACYCVLENGCLAGVFFGGGGH